jgi:hypothetical protein
LNTAAYKQQQIVDMAAVAGHVDDLALLGPGLDAIDVTDGHALVETIPEPRENTLHESHEWIREVSGDLVGIGPGLFHGIGPAQAIDLHFPLDGRLNRPGLQDLADHGSPMRQVGADGGHPLATEMDPQDARELADGPFRRQALGDQLADGDRGADLHHDVTPVDDDHEKLAQGAADGPVVGQKQFQGGPRFLRRTAPEYRHGNDTDVVGLPVPHGPHDAIQPGEIRGPASRPAEKHRRAGFPQPGDLDTSARWIPFGTQAHLVEHRGFSEPLALQHETHGPVSQGHEDLPVVLGDPRSDPDEKYPPDQAYPETVETHMTPTFEGAQSGHPGRKCYHFGNPELGIPAPLP